MKERYLKGGWVNVKRLPKGDNGRPLCRWCGVETSPPRRTFCSDECVHQHKMRTNGQYLRRAVFARDNGVCGKCGVDTEELRVTLMRFRGDLRAEFMREHSIPAHRVGGRLWDADHIVAVHQGGGQATLDNMQTLCIPCHKAKTKAQASERAAHRRMVGSAKPPEAP